MVGRLHHGIFGQSEPLPPNIDIGLRFLRSPDQFVLMSSIAKADYQIKITDLKVYFHYCKLEARQALALEARMRVGNLDIHIVR